MSLGVELQGRRFLVTGGTGFLGTYVWQELVRRGASVRLVDHRPSTLLDRLPPDERPELVLADIRHGGTIARAAAGMDGVFHCAALPSIARGARRSYEEVNVGGTERVVTAAERAGAGKLVYVSSSTVYGVPDHSPLHEDDPLHPTGPYSRTKLRAERIVLGSRLPAVVIRPRVIMGPGRLGIFALLFRRVATSKPVYIMGRGENRFQFTHVLDVVSASLLGMATSASGVFNVGSEDMLGVRAELEALVAHARSASRVISLPAAACRAALRALSLVGVSPLVHEQFSIADREFVLDTQRARAVLGWQPTASNVDMLLEAYDWFVAHPGATEGDGALLGRRWDPRQGAFQQ